MKSTFTSLAVVLGSIAFPAAHATACAELQTTVHVQTVADEINENGGWLGVQIAPVPAPLAAQLGLSRDEGLLVTNIAVDSAADEAGITQYDVMTQIDGDRITAHLATLVERISETGPGTEVNLTLFRNGEEIEVTVTLGRRTEIESLEWQFDYAPERIVQEQLSTRGRFLKRNDQGVWQLLDLGDLANLDLPSRLRYALPRSSENCFKFFVDDGECRFEATTLVDGERIEWTRDTDGKITVRRTVTDDDGNTETTEQTYDSREQFEELDPEMAELMPQTGPSGFAYAPFPFVNLGDFGRRHQESAEQLRHQMSEAMKAYSEALKVRLSGAVNQDRFSSAIERLREQLHPGPRHHFELQPDGSIHVHVANGGDKLTTIYTDRDDLEARDPDLFERFEALHAGQE